MKSIIKIIILSLSMVVFAVSANAQMKVSPFRPLPKPKQTYSITIGQAIKSDTSAWRFSSMAGYNITTKQLMAGIGYGIQWLHFDEATGKFYTDFSVQAVGWVNGSTPPTLNPPNFASFGITVGFLNQLIQAGAAYTPATATNKGGIGFVVNLGIPFNN